MDEKWIGTFIRRTRGGGVPGWLGRAFLLLFICLTACSRSGPDTGETPTVEEAQFRVDETTVTADDPLTVLQPVLFQLGTVTTAEEYEESKKGFSRPQQILAAVLVYRGEVNNQGHFQFFAGTAGVVWADALAGFEALLLPEAAAILQESARLLGGTPALDQAGRQRQLESSRPDFSNLDARWMELQQKINIDTRLTTYIRSHARFFYFDGTVQRPAANSEEE